MGNDSIKDDNAKKIKDDFSNVKKIHSPNWIFPEAVVDVYCGEHPVKNVQCRLQPNPFDPDGPWVTAYASSWVSRGRFWNTYNIVLCPRFFNEKYALEEILKNITDGTLDRYDAQNYKKAWGFTYIHELMHLDPIIADKEVWDVAYGSCDVAKIAYQNRCSGPVYWWPPGSRYRGDPVLLNNADSFAFFGAASLSKYRLGMGEPAKANDTCDIKNPNNLANETYSIWDATSATAKETIVDGVLLATDNRTDGTYNYTVSPNPGGGNTPADDEVVPLLSPYSSRPLPTDLARLYADAVAYFSSRTTTSEMTYPPTTVPASLISVGLLQSSTAPVSPSTSSSSNASACVGNQVEGSCTQATLPSETPNGGTELPVCNKVDSASEDYLMFNDDKAAQAANTYCSNLHDDKVVLDSKSSPPTQGFVANAAEKGGYVALAVLFDVGSCDPGTSTDNQKVDFGAMSPNECVQYLYTTIKSTCAKDNSWPDYNKAFSIEGGTWASKCALWSVSGLPGSPP